MKIRHMGSVAVVALLAAASPAAPLRPHIVVIVVDDMGYGDPGCYNPASKIPTPHIDSLAAAGMRFSDAHASGPLCHMSRYGLMTGRYPFRTDVRPWRTQPLIEEDRLTIASLASSEGYRTAMVGKWHLGFAEQGYDRPLPGGPVDRGFATYFGIRASTDIPPYFYIRGDRVVTPPTRDIAARRTAGWSPIQGEFWRAGKIAQDLELHDVLPRFTDEAIDVIEGHPFQSDGPPLMLYLAYPAPHTPWLPSEEFVGRSGASLYGDFAVMVDAMIGRVLKALDDAGVTQETLVLVTSDNGPVWFPADVERFGHDASGGLRGMKGDAWECGHRVPFIVRWPGQVPAGAVRHHTICFTDVMATLAELFDVELPDGAGPDSASFLGVLQGRQGEDEPVRESLVIRSGGGVMTVRHGDWKLIQGLGSGGFSEPRRVERGPDDPAGQLYDLAEDLGETRNLYAARPDIVARLEAELAAVRSE